MSDFNGNFENNVSEENTNTCPQEPNQQEIRENTAQSSSESTNSSSESRQDGGYSGGDPARNTGWTSGSARNGSWNSSSAQNSGWNNGYQQQNPGWTPPAQRYQNPYGGYQNQQDSVMENNEPYKWNFEEYDNARSKKRSHKNTGLKIFGAVIGCVAGLAILALAGVGGWYMISGGFVENDQQVNITSSSSSAVSLPEDVPNTSVGLTLTDRPNSQSSAPADTDESAPLSTPDIADKVKPSVVGILNYSNSGSSVQAILTPSEGSGIIMSEDGYILTNAHVVSGAAGLKVVMEDGNEYEARIVGADELTDIAVIKVEATGLPYAEFGNSDQLRVGEKVIAIGNPRGLTLAGSVTQGIVSAVNRSLSTNGSDITYIQTDAAINPGNSGGALVNEYGQVIGINTAKMTQSAVSGTAYEGLGFAIPISEAKPIIDDLKAYGRVTGRVRIGVTVQTVDAYTAAIYGVPQGAIVASTEEGSDIAAKGVISGDIIYSVDGQTISSSDELKAAIIGKKPGDTVTLGIYRFNNGQRAKQFDVDVVLMEDTGSTANE